MVQGRYVFPFSQLRMTDVDRVGGKNASLGELLSQLTSAGIRVPDGFATTAEAFRLFLKEGGLEERIAQRLTTLDVDDVKALAAAGAEIRGWIEAAPFPAELEKEIREFYEWLKDGSLLPQACSVGSVDAVPSWSGPLPWQWNSADSVVLTPEHPTPTGLFGVSSRCSLAGRG